MGEHHPVLRTYSITLPADDVPLGRRATLHDACEYARRMLSRRELVVRDMGRIVARVSGGVVERMHGHG